MVSIHEAGHACAAAAKGIAVRVIDVTSRHGGSTQVASPLDDTAMPWETSTRMHDRIVVALSGSAAERVILNDFTDGGEHDNASAVQLAMNYVTAGFAGPGVFVGEDGLPYGYLTDEIKTKTILRVQEIVEAARVRADAFMAAHIDALIFVATALYEKRRLSDDRLADVLVAAGFELPRPTA